MQENIKAIKEFEPPKKLETNKERSTKSPQHDSRS